jgi:hypothetical protein
VDRDANLRIDGADEVLDDDASEAVGKDGFDLGAGVGLYRGEEALDQRSGAARGDGGEHEEPVARELDRMPDLALGRQLGDVDDVGVLARDGAERRRERRRVDADLALVT